MRAMSMGRYARERAANGAPALTCAAKLSCVFLLASGALAAYSGDGMSYAALPAL